MEPPSTKPYLLRALHEWCCDNGFTPSISVFPDATARVPREFVRDGQITLNIGLEATGHLMIANEGISFQARFGGVPRDIAVPIRNVLAIYAKENGAGMAFEPDGESRDGMTEDLKTPAESGSEPEPPPAPPAGRPKLQRIK